MSIWLNPFIWLIEKTLNPLITSDTHTAYLAKQLANKRIAFICQDPNLILQVDINHQGKLRLFSDTQDQAQDLTLSGSLQQWIKQANAVEQNHLIVDIEGDVQLAAKLHQLMQTFDIDWGALLEPYIGSSFSQLSHLGLKGIHQQTIKFIQNIKRSSTEYLHYESDISVSANEAEYFYTQVDELNQRIDRLSARLQRLTTSQHNSSSN